MKKIFGFIIAALTLTACEDLGEITRLEHEPERFPKLKDAETVTANGALIPVDGTYYYYFGEKLSTTFQIAVAETPDMNKNNCTFVSSTNLNQDNYYYYNNAYYVVSGLKTNTTYYYRYYATDSYGGEQFSQGVKSFTTDSRILTLATPTVDAYGNVTLTANLQGFESQDYVVNFYVDGYFVGSDYGTKTTYSYTSSSLSQDAITYYVQIMLNSDGTYIMQSEKKTATPVQTESNTDRDNDKEKG